MKFKQFVVIITFVFAGMGVAHSQIQSNSEQNFGLRKIKDVVVYQDSLFYSAFPSVIKRLDGEFLVAFRRAPDRRLFGQQEITHTDPNSYMVMVRSRDGENWTKEPDLIFAHLLEVRRIRVCFS